MNIKQYNLKYNTPVVLPKNRIPILSFGYMDIMDENPERIPWRYSKKYGYQYYNSIKKKWFKFNIK